MYFNSDISQLQWAEEQLQDLEDFHNIPWHPTTWDHIWPFTCYFEYLWFTFHMSSPYFTFRRLKTLSYCSMQRLGRMLEVMSLELFVLVRREGGPGGPGGPGGRLYHPFVYPYYILFQICSILYIICSILFHHISILLIFIAALGMGIHHVSVA